MARPASGWPFLVARGRRKGYRTVLAPDFLVAAGHHGRLAERASGAGSGVQCIDLDVPGAGWMTVLYRSEALGAADLNGHGDGRTPTDEHGRPLELVYGIVARERLAAQLDEDDLAAARDEALDSYRRFLSAEESFDVDASRAIELLTAARPEVASTPPTPPSPPPSAAGPRSPGAVAAVRSGGGLLAAGVTIALLGVLLTWQLWPRSDVAPLDLRVIDQAIALVDVPGMTCEELASFRLTATLRADARAVVSYRWEPAAAFDPATRGGRLTLEQAKDTPITATTVQLSAEQRRPPVTLVLDAAPKQPGTTTYRLLCR